MVDFLISIGFIGRGGQIERNGEAHSPADFGGSVPSVGDRILNPGVSPAYRGEKIDFGDPARRTFWVVQERIFRPDMPGCLLLCEEVWATERDINIIG